MGGADARQSKDIGHLLDGSSRYHDRDCRLGSGNPRPQDSMGTATYVFGGGADRRKGDEDRFVVIFVTPRLIDP